MRSKHNVRDIIELGDVKYPEELLVLNPDPLDDKITNATPTTDAENSDHASHLKHIPYPKSVFFIVSNEFCERFSYYGMRTILSIYLTTILLYSESDTKIIYHTFTMFVYFFPIFGAILSDSFLGKFRTILYVSIIYAIGNIVLSLAATDPIGLPQRTFTIIGLLLIAVGTGGIKPCVSAFGGDQFVLPNQETQLASFFSMFYFSINAGSLISTFLTPVLREDVHCFGNEHCFPLAFGIPGILMITSVAIFALGKPLYKIRKPEGNVVVQVASCIGHAIKKKIKSDRKVDHWLDHSEEHYGKKLVRDIKVTLKVLVLYIPLPIFWALYDQQGTAWTFQAVQMNGDIGFYTILPDQIQVINPLLILAFIPLFTYVVYPFFEKFGIFKSRLQRMVCGGLLAALAYAVSAGVSLALEATNPVLPSDGNCQLRLYNTLNCDIKIESKLVSNEAFIIESLGYKKIDVNNVKGTNFFDYQIIEGCIDGNSTGQFNITEKSANSYYITQKKLVFYEDKIDKASDGLPVVRTLTNGPENLNLTYTEDSDVILEVPSTNYSLFSFSPGTYKLQNSNKELSFELGGVYTVVANLENSTITNINLIEVTQANSVHILWLIPQYVIITAAEILFSITGLEFSYSQAPESMKAVLQASFLLTTAIGNLIIVIIESAKIFDKQSSDFFLYAGLMVLDMICFAFMAMRYKPVQKDDETDTEELQNGLDAKKVNAIDNPSFNHNSNETNKSSSLE